MKKVLVIGVFNILHPGHVRFLRFASSCGDYLVVAIQSDKVVKHNIHVKEDLRLESVKSNIYVNEAFITDDSTEEIVKKIRPDVLVKGREYEGKENPELVYLKEYGVEMVFDSGDSIFSSLDLINKKIISNTLINKLPKKYMDRHAITTHTLLKNLKKINQLKIAVIGDLIMDEYIICDALGMSQEDPTIVVTPIDKKVFIGGAGIVAAHAAGLGSQVHFFSITGNDDMSVEALNKLQEAGVNTNLLVDKHRPTTLKKRYRCKGKTLLRVSHLHQSDISLEIQKELILKIKLIIDDIDLIVLSDFNYGCLPQNLVNNIIKMAKDNNISVAADSQSSSQIGDVSRYKNIDLLTPTEHEARIALQDQNSGLVVLSENLRNKTFAKNILLKLGEEGVLIHSEDNDGSFSTDQIRALNINPKDVSGAGDSMLITAAMVLCADGTIWDAALLGSISAGLQVSKLGNQPLSLNELIESIDR
jgi:rfaE bifunctional protein kinase chain/domain